MRRKALVLDANILIRAVLGKRVRNILAAYADRISFFVPEAAYLEAQKHLSYLVVRHGGDSRKASDALTALVALITLVDGDLYGEFEQEALKRLGDRDPEDWPVIAAALALECPIWTEDTDFFGCGVATWTSGRIEIFLRETDTLE